MDEALLILGITQRFERQVFRIKHTPWKCIVAVIAGTSAGNLETVLAKNGTLDLVPGIHPQIGGALSGIRAERAEYISALIGREAE